MRIGILIGVMLVVFLVAACGGAPVNTPTPSITQEVFSCPVTKPPPQVFVPPPKIAPNALDAAYFWYGTEKLWTELPRDGKWITSPDRDGRFTQKIAWWRHGYVAEIEQMPDLTVTGRRLDAEAPPLVASRATNAHHPDFGDLMIVGADVPTAGCWEITGQYHGATLTFVIELGS